MSCHVLSSRLVSSRLVSSRLVSSHLTLSRDQLIHLMCHLITFLNNNFVHSSSLVNSIYQNSYARVAASEPVGNGRKIGVADSIPGISGGIRTAILSAVHTEMLTKEKRALKVLITGMPISSFASDAVQFSELCSSEFSIEPTIRSTARLGKKGYRRQDYAHKPNPRRK